MSVEGLVVFLRARLGEDEADARVAGSSLHGRNWWWSQSGRFVAGSSKETRMAQLDVELGRHIARHDPGRVTAEVEAKRQIIAGCEEALASASPELVRLARRTLGRLAGPYSQHSGYLEEWRP
ncbi:DUF6221 family protein [Streptosporangium soli]|nr:DUF6221 family protein [Streptosporangium sp. KLBMP 9127]